MPEKRKSEPELNGDHEFFPAKRVRQQVSYDDLDETGTSNQAVNAEASWSRTVEENEADASGDEYGEERNWDNKNNNNTRNKSNAHQQRHNYKPRVDPVFGQRSAFPGLDDAASDELLYGPPEDGLEYLRMVR